MKADKTLHRESEGEIEIFTDFGCAIWSEPGTKIYGPNGPVWETDCRVRTLFIRGARLNLLEIHEVNSTPREVYLNVIAPADLSTYEVVYIDHELDVHKVVNDVQSARILDAEEFEDAIVTYQYDHATINECWAAARLGESIADTWQFGLSSTEALKSFAALVRAEYA